MVWWLSGKVLDAHASFPGFKPRQISIFFLQKIENSTAAHILHIACTWLAHSLHTVCKQSPLHTFGAQNSFVKVL